MSEEILIESNEVAAAKAALTRVRMLPHPFSIERVEKHVDAGQTVYEIMGAVGCRPGRAYLVFINGVWLPSEMWKRVRPKPHTEVVIKAVPMGGGGGGDQNKTMRTILQVVVVIVALAIIVATQGAGAPLAGTMWAGTTGLLLATGVSVVGNLAIAALLPPKFKTEKAPGREDPGFSITGARNIANVGGCYPKVYGRHRLVPSHRRPA